MGSDQDAPMDIDKEDFEMQMAMALSASAVEAESRDTNLPEYLVVHAIQPNGWCFLHECFETHVPKRS